MWVEQQTPVLSERSEFNTKFTLCMIEGMDGPED
jgi:hypothetical protein